MRDDVLEKIKRANQHIDNFHIELRRFIESNPYLVGVKRNSDTRQPIYYLKSARKIPPEMALIAGDALQNLRSALDYLACALVCSAGGVPDGQTAFPVLDEAPLSPQDRPFARKVKGMKQDAVNAIWDIKPFKGGDDRLWRLHKLNNRDKHALLLTTNLAFRNLDVKQHARETNPPRFPGRVTSYDWHGPAGSRFNLKAGDELFIDLPDAKVNENIKFTFDVAFNEPGICEGEPIILVIRASLNRVRHVVEWFDAMR